MSARLPPAIRSLHHVAIQVNDLAAACQFYGRVLGLAELDAPPSALEQGIRWFDLGGGRALHMVETHQILPISRAHFAISVDDVKAWRSYIERVGIEIIEPRVSLYGAERLFMRDPSGNLLELVKWDDEPSG